MPTIGGSVVQNARRVPDREAIVAGDRRWTWAQADADVALVAGRLRAAGVQHGDRVALVSANSPEHVLTSWAASRLGAIVVPVNTRLAHAETRHVLDNAQPRVVAVESALVPAVRAALPAGCSATDVMILDQEELLHPSEGDGSLEPVQEDHAAENDDAFIIYTSGTTGRPKGVLLDHHRAVWAAMAQVVTLGMRDGERYLHLPPLYHSGGVVYLNAMALLGGTNVLLPAFEAGLVLDTIERERITALLGVPTMFQFLLRHPDVAVKDTSSWRLAAFGAAPMAASSINALLHAFPTVSFFQQCGQTEGGPTGLYSTPEQVRADPDSSGHQGQPFVEATIAHDDDASVGLLSVGELHLRGEVVMKGYWRDPVATREAFDGAWLRTGDVVELKDSGAMKLVDRLKDVIITGGRNVYSAEVEQALNQHPDVLDAAVLGRPHCDWGETIVAVLEVREGAHVDLDSVRAFCAPLIASYKIPRELVLDTIPRNAAGKIQKHLLRATVDGRTPRVAE